MIRNIKKLILLLSPRERKKGFLIIFISLLMALFDALSASLFMTFMSLINDNKFIYKSKPLNVIKDYFGINSNFDFISLFGICVILIILFSILLKALNNYAQVRFTHTLEYTIAKRLISIYLKQPYEWFLNKNSSDIGKTILNEMAELSRVSINSLLTLTSSLLIIISMLMVLLYVNYKVALTIIIIFIFAYYLMFVTTRLIASQIGENRFSSNADRFLAINEIFGAIKEIKIAGKEKTYLSRFSNPSLKYAISYTNAKVLQQLPRFGLEIVAFGGILTSLLYIYRLNGGIVDSLPFISLYLYAGFRILPSLQIVFSAITQLRLFQPTTDSIFKDFNELKIKNDFTTLQKIIFPKNKIKLSEINFQYLSKGDFCLNNISIDIKANKSTAIVGSTGSGKSTLVDIILGLLIQTKGEIYIDNLKISYKNRQNWQRSIGYVPQSIYLSDESIAANIAFGIEPNKIDFDKLIKVSKIAKIHTYIENELPKKYYSKIGERGVKLSGGQRQRIGIARALYKSPKVLILDEATSALDVITEKEVMQGIYKLGKQLTIIVIAHRLNTIKSCDQIILIKNGEVNDIGIYEELAIRNNMFKEMIKDNELLNERK